MLCIFYHTQKLHISIESFRTKESRAADMWHGLPFSDLTAPLFPPSFDCDLINFLLFKAPSGSDGKESACNAGDLGGLSWVQWWNTSTETWISIPRSPGIMSSSASLFPALHPELANVCYLQKFPITARAVSAGSCVCVTGRGRESLLIAMYQCAEHKNSLRCL